MRTIHPTAIVPIEALRGDGITVGPFVVVEAGAEIDAGCTIGPHAYIGARVRLGANVSVGHGASIGGPPQVRPACESPGGVIIGRGTTIREYVTVNAASKSDGYTCVGRNALLMAYAHVGHDCDVGDNATLVNSATLGGFAVIEHHATLSAMVPVHQYCRVGAYSYVGGGYRVVQDVPPYLLAAGDPLQPHGLNVVGLRRAGFSSDQLRRLKAIYRHVYRSGLNFAQALERFDELESSVERDVFIAFMRISKRGMIR